ncbi:MAG TPA: hypothetical protein PLB81_02510 [Deltaproteobacteria bacterium]|nr:hypothetical protein [Deltaproteobacteria bacterium]
MPAVCLCVLVASVWPLLQPEAASGQDSVASQKAFADAAQVFFHPRCLNCHPAGDAPLIKDDSQPHLFGVKRGADGKGVAPLSCALCHRDANQPGGPPGVPGWHMPPEHMPMVFQGRTPGELCRQLKDPRHNGGRTGVQVIEHIDKDPLVLWGWSPGQGRTVPKMSHEDFAAKMHEWVKKGCACPD